MTALLSKLRGFERFPKVSRADHRHCRKSPAERAGQEGWALRGMSPEASSSELNERYEHSEERNLDVDIEHVDSIAMDLAGRIDRFLNGNPASEVRRGTQSKIRESLQVIRKALTDYGYLHPLRDGDS